MVPRGTRARTRTHEMYRLLFENSPDGILFADGRGGYDDANKRACEILGYPREELLKLSEDDIDVNDHPVKNLSPSEALQQNARRQRCFRHKEGRLIPVEVTVCPLSDGKSASIIRPIPEGKQPQDVLHKSEEQYRSLFEHMIEGFAYCEMVFENGKPTDWVYLAVNDAFVALTGLKNATGKRVSEVIPGIRETDPGLFEVYSRVALTGKPERIEIFVQVLKQWFDISVYCPEKGFFVAVFDVITERKRVERQLQENQHFIESVVNTTPELVYIYDLEEHRNVYSNRELVKVLGYSQEQVLQMRDRVFEILLHPDDTIVVAEQHKRLRSAGDDEVLEVNYRMRDSKGQWRWLHSRDRVFSRDAGGSVRQIIGTASETTEHKEAEAALRSSEENYRLLFVNNPVPMLVFDAGSLAFLAVNDFAVDHYGYSRAEFLNMTIRDIRPPEFLHELDEALSMNPGAMKRVDTATHRKKDGSLIEVEISAHEIIFEGRKAVLVLAMDITERRKIERAVRTSEDKFSKAFKVSPDSININRLSDGKYIEINDGFTAITGYTADEVIGRSSLDLDLWANPEDRMRLVEGLREHAEVTNLEVSFRMKDGHLLTGLMSARTIEVNGETCILSITRDISERKRAEQALRMFQHSIDRSSDAIFWIDREGGFTYVNEKACSSLGYARPELMGLRLWDIDPVYPRAVWTSNWEGYQKNKQGGGENVETIHRRKDGTTFPVDVSSAHLWFGDEELHVAVVRDITERKNAEKALRESEERYHTLALTVPDPLTAVDLHGNITFVSQLALQFYGYKSESEVLGRNVVEWVIDSDKERATATLAEVISGGSLSDKVFTVLKSDGSSFFAEVSGSCMRDAQGVPTGALILVRDITERRELQSRLAQAQKMEAVGRLAGGVAHDFNNMIAVIQGYAMLVQDKLGPLDPLHRYVEAIVSASQRSANLTRQLLAFARKQVVSPLSLNLNDEVSSLQKMLTRLIGEDIELQFRPGKDLWNVKIDPSQVDQIFANLSTNARDAIADVGTIIIETSNVIIDEEYCKDHVGFQPGEYVMLAFSDTGAGMDKATVAKIFEPFFTTKDEGKGTGLGLATVFGIVKQNNGFINVYSEPGLGTTFRLYFSRFYGVKETPVEKREVRPLHGSETILIVEDEEQLLDLARSAMEAYGYEVLGAHSPGDAILLCVQHKGHISLVISDVVLPGMNGKELCERLREIRPGIKTLFMSGYTADIVAHRGILEEGVQFLQKPFTPVTLAKKVREVLDM